MASSGVRKVNWRRGWLLGAVVLVGGCTGLGYYENPPQTAVPVGLQLEVSRPFVLPAGRYRVWFQLGAPVQPIQLSIWQWHCALELHERAAATIDFDGGALLVTGVRYDPLAGAPAGPLRRVALPIESDRGSWTIVTVITLASADYPQVRRLRCEREIDTALDDNLIDLPELAGAVGGHFRLVRSRSTPR